MRKGSYYFVFLLLVAVQMLICNYLNLSPYLTLSILPVLILCVPLRLPTFWTLLLAFATGSAVDLLSEGLLGLNALALVPVAFVRKEVISVRKNGFGKVALAIFLVQALFLAIYIWADGAGTRTLAFNAIRFGVSLAAGWALSLLVIDILAPDNRK